MNTEKQISSLNELIAKNYDAEYGYKEAAENVDSSKLKTMFNEYAQQRYNFGHELKSLVTSLGGEVDKGSTVASGLHRAWMDLKSAVSSNDEKSILEEVKRGEENALNNYNDALEDLTPGSTAFDTVVNQRNQIRTAITRVEQLIPVYDNA